MEPERSGWEIRRKTQNEKSRPEGALTADGGPVAQVGFLAQLMYTGSLPCAAHSGFISRLLSDALLPGVLKAQLPAAVPAHPLSWGWCWQAGP